MVADTRPIEIFAPFGGAMDLTKRILFQPFDFAKWLVIGFAAFLANLGGGVGNGFNFNPGVGESDWNLRSKSHEAMNWFDAIPGWLIVTLCITALAVIVLVIALTWVSARGRFIFIDCVVRNRGAIVAPWKEFSREGNSLFLFKLTAGLISMFLIGLAALPLWWPLAARGETPDGAALIVGVILVAAVFVILLLIWVLAAGFMTPIMYRRRCGAMQGFRESFALLMSRPGPVILFFLFCLVLGVAIAILACVATCLTCCLAAIPYVGTVILLPIYVFWESFRLLFLRQFGPEYDAWENLAVVDAGTPPMQSVPPPAEPPPPPQV